MMEAGKISINLKPTLQPPAQVYNALTAVGLSNEEEGLLYQGGKRKLQTMPTQESRIEETPNTKQNQDASKQSQPKKLDKEQEEKFKKYTKEI